jgi:hypothetical protein
VSASSFPQLDVPGIVMLDYGRQVHSAAAVTNAMQAFMLKCGRVILIQTNLRVLALKK